MKFLWLPCLALLCACEQTIVQQVDVPPAVVHVQTVIQPPAQSNIQPTLQPRPLPNPSPRPATGTQSAAPLPLPEIPLKPIAGPSAASVMPPELERFADSIPEPEITAAYDSRSIEMAAVLWQQRYTRSRANVAAVLGMYLDAALLAWHNENLTATLNQTIMHSKVAFIVPDFARLDAEAVAKEKEYAIRSYFQGTAKFNNYLLPDFEQRQPHFVSKNSRGEYTTLSAGDVAQLASASPREGDSVKLHLLSSAGGEMAEVTLIYHKGGWKIDYWAPNILVLKAG
ncbi:MAG: hypothetical protein CVV27_11740 [Candidatus Melainabacteria bacterium HGW-Melainabacteria-1]|nr:MAG: hypothetical protein CVV27_11740 [Candidatus Melainabacteria bacterium HGW-Melainabacteria-1]